MAVGDIYKVRVCCYTPDQIGLNILHYTVAAETGVGSSLALISQAFDTAFAVPYKAAISASAKYRGVGAQKILPGPPVVEFPTTVNDGDGTSDVGLAPCQVSGIISWSDGRAVRQGRGRSYIPFPASSMTDANGKQAAAYAALILSVATAIGQTRVCGIVGNQTTLVFGLFHRLPLPGNFTEMQLSRLPAKWATQRRRGQFGRTNVLPF